MTTVYNKLHGRAGQACGSAQKETGLHPEVAQDNLLYHRDIKSLLRIHHLVIQPQCAINVCDNIQAAATTTLMTIKDVPLLLHARTEHSICHQAAIFETFHEFSMPKTKFCRENVPLAISFKLPGLAISIPSATGRCERDFHDAEC